MLGDLRMDIGGLVDDVSMIFYDVPSTRSLGHKAYKMGRRVTRSAKNQTVAGFEPTKR